MLSQRQRGRSDAAHVPGAPDPAHPPPGGPPDLPGSPVMDVLYARSPSTALNSSEACLLRFRFFSNPAWVSKHEYPLLRTGVPNLQDLMPDDLWQG